jgi:drug/metabolite transporter (DMT)-like permease
MPTSWTLLVPVVGLVLSVLVLGESLTVKQVLGTAIVVAAMALVAKSGRPHSDRLARWQQNRNEVTAVGD